MPPLPCRLFDRSALYLVPVSVLAVVWNIPKFWEMKTCYIPSDKVRLMSGHRIYRVSHNIGSTLFFRHLNRFWSTYRGTSDL